MKKFLKVTLALMLVLTVLTGCGGSSMSKDSAPAMKNEIAVESPAAPVPDYEMSISQPGQSVPGAEQKLIRTVRMDVETEDLEALLPQINGKITALGGYVENQELYNGSS